MEYSLARLMFLRILRPPPKQSQGKIESIDFIVV